MLITATYQKQIYAALSGAWLDQTPIEISAECEQHGDTVTVVWTDETLATIADHGLDAEEVVGCQEAVEQAFFEGEREQCRLANVRQRAERAA